MIVQSVFISYATEDRDIADRVRVYLETKARIRVWVAHEDLVPGTSNWEEEIRTTISKVDGVVLIATPKARASQFVRGELDLADKHERTIYPLWARGDDRLDAIPLGYAAIQSYDVRGDTFEAGMQKLVDCFRGIVGPEERIRRNDTQYLKEMQREERERIVRTFRQSVKSALNDKTKTLLQKLPTILDAGSLYLDEMAAFEKHWGDRLLPVDDSMSKNMLTIVNSLQRAARNKESTLPARGYTVAKHLAQLLLEFERHWGTDKDKTIEGSVAPQLPPEADGEEG